VLICCGDTPLLTAETLRTFLERHHEAGGDLSVLTMVLDEPGGYGRILRDGRGRVEGIVEAIRTYYASGLRISLYVLGDEFTGASVDSVVRAVDMINREDKSGQRRVRIHAIGFPVRPDAPQYTSVRFATLMRILCDRNGGTFVGLNEPGSYRR
jgi:hypothetical protein